MQGAFIVSFYILRRHCARSGHDSCVLSIFDVATLSPQKFCSLHLHPRPPAPARPSLTSRASIVHHWRPARSDWETAPLRQGGIHATFLRISCRNIEHTRHMGGILLLCACAITLFIHCSSMWEKVCIIHEIISAYNDESNEYQHSELLVNKWTKAI